jgi:purine nucleosidase
MTVSLLLDTDIGTDVDDALALAFALRHPGIDLRAVTTVSGDARRRARIAAKLLRLGGREDIEVAVGETGPEDRASEMGHEGDGFLEPGDPDPASPRDAVRLLLEETAGERLTVATVGSQSNLAAALDRDPALAGRIERLAVMGGDLDPGAPGEHNLNVDRAASVRALGDAGLETLLVPFDVTRRTTITTAALERLRAADPLCRALATLIERWVPVLRTLDPHFPGDVVAAMHDPLTLAVLVAPDLVEIERLNVSVAEHDGQAHTRIDPEGRPMDVVRDVDAAALADLWLGTVLG